MTERTADDGEGRNDTPCSVVPSPSVCRPFRPLPPLRNLSYTLDFDARSDSHRRGPRRRGAQGSAGRGAPHARLRAARPRHLRHRHPSTIRTSRTRWRDASSATRRARGVLLCGTGLGMAYAANRHPGVRAAVAWTPEIARLAREHNDANVLVLPARFVSEDEGVEILRTWLATEFAGGRHSRRVAKIDQEQG